MLMLTITFFLPKLIPHSEIICYDDGCHLKRYANNAIRKSVTPQSMQIANTSIVVDKLHFAGHTDKWCREHCDPRSFKELDNVRMCIPYFTT